MSFKGIDVRQQNTDWLVIRALLLDSSGAKVASGSARLYLYEVQVDGSLKSFDFYDKKFKTTTLAEEWLFLGHQKGNGGATDTGIWTAGFQVRTEEESSSSSSVSSSSSSSSSSHSRSSSSTSTSLSTLSSSSTSSLSSSTSSASSLSSSSTSTSQSTSSSSSSSTSSQSVSESSPADETEFTTGNIYIAMVHHASASPPWQAREFQWGETEGDGLAEIADSLLTRDWTSVEDARIAARSLLQAARFIRNKFSTTASPGNVTVYKEDDATAAYTKPVTTDPAAEPIVQG